MATVDDLAKAVAELVEAGHGDKKVEMECEWYASDWSGTYTIDGRYNLILLDCL